MNILKAISNYINLSQICWSIKYKGSTKFNLIIRLKHVNDIQSFIFQLTFVQIIINIFNFIKIIGLLIK